MPSYKRSGEIVDCPSRCWPPIGKKFTFHRFFQLVIIIMADGVLHDAMVEPVRTR